MTFLSPWLLLGSLAVAVPIVLHFFYRARYRKQPWAAMEFLRLALEQTSRRLRFQELVLLLLRCLALLLLAFALARPALTGVASGGRGESVDAIFVFDTSFSMTARDGEKTRLDRAKDAAMVVLDNLPQNSTIQIFGCADRVTALGPVSPRNLDQAKQIVAKLDATSLSTDLLPGFVEAYNALDRGAGTNKEVYLFSDVQKLGWDRQSAAIRAKCDEIKQRATLLLVRCGNPERPVRNISIADITYPGGIPHTGTRMPFTVLLRNTGKEPIRNINVALEVDGNAAAKEGEMVPEIGPGQTHPVTLTAKLDQAGNRIVTATLSGDDLPGDNRLDRIIPVRETIRVLIVDGSPDLRDPKESASHYVRNALLPVSNSDQDAYFVRVNVVTADDANPALLGVTDVCILANVPASNADRPGISGLSKEFVERLREFVTNGGGLLVGLGENVVPERYNTVLGSGGAKLLPFDLAESMTAENDRFIKIAPETAESGSFVERFRDEPFRTVMADVDLVSIMRTKPNGPGRILMRLADQQPFLGSQFVGEGEVLLLTTSLDARWGNWPSRAGSYLSFMQLALAYLTNTDAKEMNRVAGEPLVWNPPDAAKSFEVLKPDGARAKLGAATGGEAGQNVRVIVSDTQVAGIYRIGTMGDDLVRATPFAVTPSLRESDDLTTLSDDEVEQLLGFRPVFLQANAVESVSNERARREWTVWVLLVLFVLLVGESVWAWFCGKAW